MRGKNPVRQMTPRPLPPFHEICLVHGPITHLLVENSGKISPLETIYIRITIVGTLIAPHPSADYNVLGCLCIESSRMYGIDVDYGFLGCL
jgi:hypothetical protein